MIDHVWSVLCAGVITDKGTNNVTIFNVVEQIKVPRLPKPEMKIALPINVVTLWARSDFDVPANGEARLSLVSPSGDLHEVTRYAVNLREYERLRGIRGIPPVPIREAGRYVMLVELKPEGEDTWKSVAHVPLKVIWADADEISGLGEEEEVFAP